MKFFEPDIMGIQLITDDVYIKETLEQYHLLNLEIMSYSHPSILNCGEIKPENILFKDFNNHKNDITFESILNISDDIPDQDLQWLFGVYRIFIVSNVSEYKIASDARAHQSVILTIILDDFPCIIKRMGRLLIIPDRIAAAKYIRMLYHAVNSRHLYSIDRSEIIMLGGWKMLNCFEAGSFKELVLAVQKQAHLYEAGTQIFISEISNQYEQAKKADTEQPEASLEPFNLVDNLLKDCKAKVHILNCYTKEIHERYNIAFAFEKIKRKGNNPGG